ncbi:MAG TPA: hypothetical protein VF944_08810 [Candidatus Bathyarchaeia archaeon]
MILPKSHEDWEQLRSAYDDYYAPIDYGIFEILGPAMRGRGHATIEDLDRIAFWKFGSWRHRKRIGSVRNKRLVRSLTSRVFGMDKEEAVDQVRLLGWEESGLDGFGVPMASALLTVFNPKHYAVIDRYAWFTYILLLHGKRQVKTGFTPTDYGHFVRYCRMRTEDLPGWTAREVEKALFMWAEDREFERE